MWRGRGFTLVELCVALALVAIGAGFGMATLGDVISNNRIRSTAQQVADSLMLAKSEALKRNVPVAVSFSAAAVTLNFDTARACQPATCKVVNFGTSVGLSIQVDVNAANVLTFDSSGQVSGAADHAVDITNARCATEKSCLRVQLRSGGSVRICNPAQGGASAANFCA